MQAQPSGNVSGNGEIFRTRGKDQDHQEAVAAKRGGWAVSGWDVEDVGGGGGGDMSKGKHQVAGPAVRVPQRNCKFGVIVLVLIRLSHVVHAQNLLADVSGYRCRRAFK